MKKMCLLPLLVVGVLMLIPIMANAQGEWGSCDLG